MIDAEPSSRRQWCWQFVKELIQNYRLDQVGDLAAIITFWTVLSIPAAVLALVSALGPLEVILGASLVDDLQGQVSEFVETTFRESQPLQNTIDELFDADQSSVLTLTTFFALFTLSRGFAAIVRSLDSIYRIEERRSWWHVRLVAMGLGLGTITVIAGSASLVAITASRAGSLVALLIVPVTLVILSGWATMLFHLGPNHHSPWRFDLPGGIVTALGWTAASQLFALYVRVAPGGNQVQSSVGALLLGISLLYILAVVMLVGAEVNGIVTERAGVAATRTSFRDRVENARDRVASRQEEVTADRGDMTPLPVADRDGPA